MKRWGSEFSPFRAHMCLYSGNVICNHLFLRIFWKERENKFVIFLGWCLKMIFASSSSMGFCPLISLFDFFFFFFIPIKPPISTNHSFPLSSPMGFCLLISLSVFFFFSFRTYPLNHRFQSIISITQIEIINRQVSHKRKYVCQWYIIQIDCPIVTVLECH